MSAVLKPKAKGYRQVHPSADDVLLLIEVSDTTLRYDLGRRLAVARRYSARSVSIGSIAAARRAGK